MIDAEEAQVSIYQKPQNSRSADKSRNDRSICFGCIRAGFGSNTVQLAVNLVQEFLQSAKVAVCCCYTVVEVIAYSRLDAKRTKQ